MHVVSILTFPIEKSKAYINKKCDEWGDHNCDLEERGGVTGIGLGYPLCFSDMTFDNYDSAYKYLDNEPAYSQKAVKYRVYPKIEKTKKVTDLEDRLNRAKERLAELNKPHYKGVTIKSVKCKCCGSSLATAYCGKSYDNHCPICRSDLRPQSKLDQINACECLVTRLQKELKDEQKKAEQKARNKSVLRWAVRCEVHC